MPRWLWVVVAALVIVTGPASACTAGTAQDEDLHLKAKTTISGLEADPPERAPVSYGTTAYVGKKSAARAMLLSALLPGLGEIYAGGKRGYATGAVMAATDLVSMWRYLDLNNDGDEKKSEYQEYAKLHYSRARFDRYVQDTIVVFGQYEGFGHCFGSVMDPDTCRDEIQRVFPLSRSDDGTFYEQIALENRYIFGWTDWVPCDGCDDEYLWEGWNPYSELPAGASRQSTKRDQYRKIRAEADDSYGKAERFAWIMVIGRVVSMVDAAILVKLRNRDLTGFGTNPRLSFKVKDWRNPNLKVSLKLRF